LLIDTINNNEKIQNLHNEQQQHEENNAILDDYIKINLNEMLEIKGRWKKCQDKSFFIKIICAPIFVIEFALAYNISNPY
jgi:hypothetical protein